MYMNVVYETSSLGLLCMNLPIQILIFFLEECNIEPNAKFFGFSSNCATCAG